jgi:hypothetical protein
MDEAALRLTIGVATAVYKFDPGLDVLSSGR